MTKIRKLIDIETKLIPKAKRKAKKAGKSVKKYFEEIIIKDLTEKK